MNPENIRIVNKRAFKGDGQYVGRPSPMGNPFSWMEGTLAEFRVASREESLCRYKDWLLEKLDTDNPTTRMFLMLLEELKTNECLTLICWCAPKKCHGDVIKELLLEACNGN
jgi:hypothetical protein